MSLPQSILYLKKGNIFRNEYFGGLIFSIQRAQYYEINKLGFYMISLINGELSAEDIVEQTLKYYELQSDESARIELENYLLDLLAHDFLTFEAKDRIQIKEIEPCPERKYLSFPLEAYLYLTQNCNQRCMFCYNPRRKSSLMLSLDEWKNVIDKLIALRVCTIGVLGGEPFLEKNKLISILEYTNGKVHQAITTNGTANGGITKQQAKRLACFPNLEINVSLESGNPDVHDAIVGLNGALNIAKRTIENLVDAGVTVVLKMVATNCNYQDLPNLVKWAKGVGIAGAYVLDYMPEAGQTLKDFKKLSLNHESFFALIDSIEEYKDDDFFVMKNTRYRFVDMGTSIPIQSSLVYKSSICTAGNIGIHVMSDGDVFTCPLAIGNKKYKIGNVLNNSMMQIWNSTVLSDFRERDSNKLENKTCIACSKYTGCIGGCPLVAEMFTGSTYGGDPRCRLVAAYE